MKGSEREREEMVASIMFIAIGVGYLFPFSALTQPVDYWTLMFPDFEMDFHFLGVNFPFFGINLPPKKYPKKSCFWGFLKTKKSMLPAVALLWYQIIGEYFSIIIPNFSRFAKIHAAPQHRY